MASSASATVVQANLTGTELLWGDTGTYGTIISRTLNIYDCNNNLLQTVNLGATTSYTYMITADAFFKFSAIIIDNTGTFTSDVDFVATGFYTAAYLNAFTGNVPLPISNCNLDIAERFYTAALRFNVGGNFVAANSDIIFANYFVNLEQ